MTKKRVEVWVEVSRQGDPVLSTNNGRVFAWAWKDYAEDYRDPRNSVVRYIPAPTKRKRGRGK